MRITLPAPIGTSTSPNPLPLATFTKRSAGVSVPFLPSISLPVALSYVTDAEPFGPAWTVCWWGGMDLPRHVWRLLFVGGRGPIRARVRVGNELLRSGDRKQPAARTQACLEELFVPVAQEPAPPDLPWTELLEL